MESSARVLGDDHPQTLSRLDDLAGVYQRTGRYADAERTYVDVVERTTASRGAEHPATLAYRGNLISLYYYLKIVKAAYLPPPEPVAEDPPPVAVPISAAVAAALAIGLVGVLGFYPAPLWDAAVAAARAVLGG